MIRDTIISYFQEKKEVAAVYLFGSFLKGKEGPSNDLDLGILFKNGPTGKLNKKRDQYMLELSRLLRKNIHPVILNTAGESLMAQILKKGQCLLINDSIFHSRFKMVVISRITDFAYYKQQMQNGIIRKIMRG